MQEVGFEVCHYPVVLFDILWNCPFRYYARKDGRVKQTADNAAVNGMFPGIPGRTTERQVRLQQAVEVWHKELAEVMQEVLASQFEVRWCVGNGLLQFVQSDVREVFVDDQGSADDRMAQDGPGHAGESGEAILRRQPLANVNGVDDLCQFGDRLAGQVIVVDSATSGGKTPGSFWFEYRGRNRGSQFVGYWSWYRLVFRVAGRVVQLSVHKLTEGG